MNISMIKEWFSFIVAVIGCIAGVIFWIQSSSNERYERFESEIAEIRREVKEITKQNGEILRQIGKLEGLIDK
jgi:hypothetical protein